MQTSGQPATETGDGTGFDEPVPFRRLRAVLLVLWWVAAVLAWVAVPFAWLSVISAPIDGGGLLNQFFAVLLSGAAIGLGLAVAARFLWRRQWWRSALVAAMIVVLTALLVTPKRWETVALRDFYEAHRTEFAEIAVVAPRERHTPRSIYGTPLPQRLAHVSANGRVGRLDNGSGPVGIFVPRLLYVPDGATGYAWFPGPPAPDAVYHAFADAIATCYDLGDGWYWMIRGAAAPGSTMADRCDQPDR